MLMMLVQEVGWREAFGFVSERIVLGGGGGGVLCYQRLWGRGRALKSLFSWRRSSVKKCFSRFVHRKTFFNGRAPDLRRSSVKKCFSDTVPSRVYLQQHEEHPTALTRMVFASAPSGVLHVVVELSKRERGESQIMPEMIVNVSSWSSVDGRKGSTSRRMFRRRGTRLTSVFRRFACL